ncbi:hypothetical protein [Mycolicibacterium komossense]|uniref:Uncharacterized protein n=1 Tax=Mycolicibacterium komossense TaxID=1779 RepID=A0ABT3CLI4_9MYCO|nr:hypothetical protein [Mycolicibacterium komossense]MCV7230305.1 hypothetical protein [Mycolicibacterium komossense]
MTETPVTRPRSVTAAFWLWLVSVVVMVFDGLVVLTFDYTVPALFPRISGGILVAAGVVLGYLAGKSRAGDWRFARAGVALSFALIVFICAMLVTKTLGLILAPVVLFLIIASGLVTRSATALAWFNPQGAGDKSDA